MKRQHSPIAIVEAGTDEAGRGCLAGPVTAAAVILPPDFKNDLLNDSKQLTEKQRNLLRPIIEKEAVTWAVAHVSPEEIDSINILNASIEAMHRSIAQLDPQPHFIAVDGNRFHSYQNIPHHCQVKGDATYQNIAAASVLPYINAHNARRCSKRIAGINVAVIVLHDHGISINQQRILGRAFAFSEKRDFANKSLTLNRS